MVDLLVVGGIWLCGTCGGCSMFWWGCGCCSFFLGLCGSVSFGGDVVLVVAFGQGFTWFKS